MAEFDVFPDFETACRNVSAPGYWENIEREIEALRGRLPDRTVDDLLDGLQRLRARTLVPLEQREDDPTYSRTEIRLVMAFLAEVLKQRFGRDFLCLDDLKEKQREIYQKCRELEISLAKSETRKFSEIMVIFFEFFLLIHQAAHGLAIEHYLESLTPVIEGLRGFYTGQQLDALVEKVEFQLRGKLNS